MNEIVLSIRVGLAIPSKPRLQGLLQIAVPSAEGVIDCEDVPEPQVVASLGIVNGHNVEMVRPRLGRAFLNEKVATLSAGITPIAITKVAELLPAAGITPGDASAMVISMIGFASSPGTAVLPTCWTSNTWSPMCS